MFTKID